MPVKFKPSIETIDFINELFHQLSKQNVKNKKNIIEQIFETKYTKVSYTTLLKYTNANYVSTSLYFDEIKDLSIYIYFIYFISCNT